MTAVKRAVWSAGGALPDDDAIRVKWNAVTERIVAYADVGTPTRQVWFPQGVEPTLAQIRAAFCPTCRGPRRETVGMVCQTCGTDYAAEPA